MQAGASGLARIARGRTLGAAAPAAVAALLAAVAALLAWCGSPASAASAPRSPAATIAQMKSAVRAANSVHLDGVLRGRGRLVALNIGLTRSGEFSGTITDNGTTLTLTNVRGRLYVKATPEFLKQLKVSAALCSIMCGKYVELASAQSGALAGDFTMQKLLASLTGRLPKFANTGTTTVRGQQAQVLRAADGSTLEVAATGAPYPLRAVGKGNNGQLDFTQWNSVPRPAVPPASQVINMSALGS
jgi:hypothetical protein